MTSVYLYQAKRPYLPLLACALHLKIGRDSDSFLAAGLKHDWQASPLLVTGRDLGGAVVCCLVHGRRQELYSRTMDGLTGIFGIALTRLDLDKTLSSLTLGEQMQARLAAWLPKAYGQGHRAAVALLIRPSVTNSQGGCG